MCHKTVGGWPIDAINAAVATLVCGTTMAGGLSPATVAAGAVSIVSAQSIASKPGTATDQRKI